MARAMRLAAESGRLAYLAGRIPKKLYATASSPTEGRLPQPRRAGKSGDCPDFRGEARENRDCPPGSACEGIPQGRAT